MSYSYRSTRASSVANRYSRSKNGQRKVKNRQGRSEYIDPNRFIKPAHPVEAQSYEAQNSFADFELHDVLHQNLANRGYVMPSPIQDQSIPHILEGRDLIGIANTGTGKTAAFLIPLINKVLKNRHKKILIMAPTRELAVQIHEEFEGLRRV